MYLKWIEGALEIFHDYKGGGTYVDIITVCSNLGFRGFFVSIFVFVFREHRPPTRDTAILKPLWSYYYLLTTIPMWTTVTVVESVGMKWGGASLDRWPWKPLWEGHIRTDAWITWRSQFMHKKENLGGNSIPCEEVWGWGHGGQRVLGRGFMQSRNKFRVLE